MAQRKRATINDIAKSVGVNPSTVSRALNPSSKSKISPKVIKKITVAASKLGYYRNRAAAMLVQKKSYTIGAIIPDLQNPVFPPMIRGLQDVFDKAGYTLILSNSENNKDFADIALSKFQEWAVDGCVLATANREDDIIKKCIQNDISLVLINRTVDDNDVSSVITDDIVGIRSAFNHLVELGHKNIAHIAGPQDTSTGFERYREYISCMKMNDFKDALVEYTDAYNIEEGRLAFQRLWNAEPKVTAIIAGNDLIALGCIDAMHELDLVCPRDVSLVGYNDIPFVNRIKPALTTVSIPKYNIGVRAAEELLKQLDSPDNKDAKKEVIKLQTELVVRESTAAPRKSV
ncbi:Ribose operon repressor [hydrothermal vent metagenome]|uniref:Ribose operon repressor n=1 Tax=hydrothermal vent metagenome TaxID=652676 RepID=A0A3B0RUT0_9ZZZZ